MKAIRCLLLFGATIAICLITVWLSTALGGNTGDSSVDGDMSQQEVVLAGLRTAALERIQIMSSDERVLFTKYLEMRARWERQAVTSAQMNGLLNWSSRKMKCSVVSPRTTLCVGDNIRIAAVLKNLSDRPVVVFPFEIARITERGHMVGKVRVDSFGLSERPAVAGNLWLVPAGDELVVPFDLAPQPVGAYRVNVALSLARFQEDGPKNGYDMSVQVNGTLKFNVLPASGAVSGDSP
jgi:hypothetical protein